MKSTDQVYKLRGHLSYGRRFISFLLFSVVAYITVFNFVLPFTASFDPESYNPVVFIFVIIIPIIAGVVVGTRKSMTINRTKKEITTYKEIMGLVYTKKHIVFESLSHVSFLRNYANHYEARLFYDENKFINLFERKNRKKAFHKTQSISNALSIYLNNVAENDTIDSAPRISREEREVSVFLSQGTRPWWQTLIAASAFAIFFFLVFQSISAGGDAAHSIRTLIQDGTGLLVVGFAFSMVKDFLFDLKNMHYKIIYRIGPFQYSRWKLLTTLERVSVHQRSPGEFLVTLWYNRRHQMILSIYGTYESALDAANQVAVKFQIDLLNIAHRDGRKLIAAKDLT